MGLLRVRGGLVGLVSGLVLGWVGVPEGVDDHVRRDGWTAVGRCSARIGVWRRGLRMTWLGRDKKRKLESVHGGMVTRSGMGASAGGLLLSS